MQRLHIAIAAHEGSAEFVLRAAFLLPIRRARPRHAPQRRAFSQLPHILISGRTRERRTMLSIRRKLDRAGYWALNIGRELALQSHFRRRLGGILADADRYDAAYLSQRVGLYNKLSQPLQEREYSARISNVPLGASMYYLDLKEHARYFPGRFQLNHVFGDGVDVPNRPSFLKARPLFGDNQNSILLKLDKFRLYNFINDQMDFRAKKPMAVWRGGVHNRKRVALLRRRSDHRLCDVGATAGRLGGVTLRPFLSAAQQLRFKYVISIEGNDLATNLRWILASNSLCLMPAPIVETWSMEGRLEAGKHYVRLRDDFEDLEEKVLYYESNTGEALENIGTRTASTPSFAARRASVSCRFWLCTSISHLRGNSKPTTEFWRFASPPLPKRWSPLSLIQRVSYLSESQTPLTNAKREENSWRAEKPS
jgi:hypothetical protein